MMSRCSIFFLVATSILFTTNLHAQVKDSFSKGILILKNDKKIEGYIEEGELAQMSSEIKFKSSLSDKELKRLTAGEVKHIELENGEIYDLIEINAPKQPDKVSG